MTFAIDVPRKYDLLTSIHAWIYPDIQPVPEQTTDTTFYRIYVFDEELVPIFLNQSTSGQPIHVDYAASSTSENEIRNRIIQTLGLEVDMSGALKRVRDDDTLAAVYHGVAGIRPYQSPTVFEALVKTIIQQQVSYRAANLLTRKLILSIGQKILLNDRIYYSFPSALDIVKHKLEGLQNLGFGYKAQYVHGVAKLTIKNSLDLEDLRAKTHDEVISLLKPIHGIGLWTIDTLAIAGLGNFGVFPLSDLGIRNLLGRLYNDGQRVTIPEVATIAQQWGNDHALVLYLMMCADVLGLFGNKGRQKNHKRD